MMKRLICTLAALAMLIWTFPTARAQLNVEFRRDQEWVITSIMRLLRSFLRTSFSEG
jgi:hypothetical protein